MCPTTYGRRKYKKDFIKFLIYSHASNDETINHLKKIIQLYPTLAAEGIPLMNEYNTLGAKLNKFIQYVTTHWKT